VVRRKLARVGNHACLADKLAMEYAPLDFVRFTAIRGYKTKQSSSSARFRLHVYN
jgi:hypothetical protein